MCLLEIAKRLLRSGPFIGRSGAVTAVASLFLGSRYAASPLQGMILAATTPGADTDTLASVTGSILAAIRAGMAWPFWLVSSRRKFCVDFLRRNNDFQTTAFQSFL